MQILDQLNAIICAHRTRDPQQSYVAQLYQRGLYKILEKIGEESTEMILAATQLHHSADSLAAQQALINETADLWFHCLVALSTFNLDHREVLAVLEQRFQQSGLTEKAGRQQLLI